jgi:hypothetical protein
LEDPVLRQNDDWLTSRDKTPSEWRFSRCLLGDSVFVTESDNFYFFLIISLHHAYPPVVRHILSIFIMF